MTHWEMRMNRARPWVRRAASHRTPATVAFAAGRAASHLFVPQFLDERTETPHPELPRGARRRPALRPHERQHVHPFSHSSEIFEGFTSAKSARKRHAGARARPSTGSALTAAKVTSYGALEDASQHLYSLIRPTLLDHGQILVAAPILKLCCTRLASIPSVLLQFLCLPGSL